jgi:pyridoxal phosphate enzyme (YggS family)
MDIASRILLFKKTLSVNVKLIVVSKTQSTEKIFEVYKTGHKIYGENKVQELITKYELLPKDIEWHFIGHLQTNKVRYIVPFVSLIHSVDSLKLLEVLNNESAKCNRVVDCLLQVKIAREDTKFGIGEDDLKALLQSGAFKQMEHIRIVGLMGMATFTEEKEMIRNEFRKCKTIFDEIKKTYFVNNPQFNELSMGMSDDYLIAVDEGSTMVRIGSLIFGQRIYNK